MSSSFDFRFVLAQDDEKCFKVEGTSFVGDRISGCTLVEIYQELNMDFMKEILDQFWAKKGWLKPTLSFECGVAITGLKVG